VRADAEYSVIKARVSPDGRVELVRRVNGLGISVPMGHVYSPELDPSPARSGDDARRLSCGEVAAQRGLVGVDDLWGEVPREPEYEVAGLFHRFGPAPSENDRRGTD
jgi:hypothetical protein